MIYAFDPGHNRVGYAGMDPITGEIKVHGIIDRDETRRQWFFADLRDLATGNPDFPFPMTVALIEDQFIKVTRSRKTQTAVAAATLKVRTVAIEILTVYELMQGIEIHMIHPKTWQTIFSKGAGWKGLFPRKSVEIKKASITKSAELGIELIKAKQDVADAICMLHWYKTVGEEKLNDQSNI